MKIVVNARLLRKNQMDGLGWFSYFTLQHIVKQNPSVEFHFLFDSGIKEEFVFADNVVPHNLFPPAKHALLNIAWFEWSVRNTLNKINPDLFFSPDGLLCLGWKGKQYGMIADLNFFHNPEDLKWSNQKYYNYFFPRGAKIAARLATISAYSKNDIVKTFNVDPDKIDIVYCGVNNLLNPVDAAQQAAVRLKWTGGKDYFIFVGTLHPRKNILRLLEAFESFKIQTHADIKLVIAGKPSYKSNEMYDQHNRMSSKDDVIFTGRIQDGEINNVLGSALALVFVPHFEGFGIPILEAMQCDVPVICSNTTSMPEVAGEAAIMVDPFNVEEIKEAMIRIYSDPALRNDLVSKGRQRKKVFSWERTSDLLWNSMEKCL
ncbi:MAG: glycosyltransferase family 1 protein [Chitinophagaceae bacterium]